MIDFEDWKQIGLANDWLQRIEGHEALRPEQADPPVLDYQLEPGEFCPAHSEGQYCCGDSADVWLVRAEA